MSVFFTDEIVIVSISTDKNGVKTEYESAPLNARVEDFNALIPDSRGQEVWADMLIFVDYDRDISYQDYIVVKVKGGVTYNQPNKKWKIKKLPLIHGFSAHHKEVYI